MSVAIRLTGGEEEMKLYARDPVTIRNTYLTGKSRTSLSSELRI